MRIDKFLSNMGYGSRKQIKIMAAKNKITINGDRVKSCSTHIDPQKDIVIVNNEKVEYKPYVYIMMNKPAGVISASEDKRHKTILDLIGEEFSHYELHPIGRLDKDTEGLIILTNDGKLTHDLLSPKKHIPKTYYAKIDSFVDEADIIAFSKGININDEYTTMPAKLEIIQTDNEQSEVIITICEGKYHQIKRMFIAKGKNVTYLKRIQMNNLQLDPSLELGNYRELTNTELELLCKK